MKKSNQPELAELTAQEDIIDWVWNNLKRFFRFFQKEEESNLMKHAKTELTLAGYDLNQKEEDPNKWMCENVLELMKVFSKQGHSGFSASYIINTFSKLAKYEILTPLTGEDDEWTLVVETTGDKIWQNKRCGSVFKDNKHKYAWDINGKIFKDKNGCTYTSRKSRVYIKKFPYTPKSVYVNDFK